MSAGKVELSPSKFEEEETREEKRGLPKEGLLEGQRSLKFHEALSRDEEVGAVDVQMVDPHPDRDSGEYIGTDGTRYEILGKGARFTPETIPEDVFYSPICMAWVRRCK